MAEAIITRRGGAGEVIVEFESFTPSNIIVIPHPDGRLFHFTPTPLSVARNDLAGASVGNYALFAGGQVDTTTRVDIVDAYSPQASVARLYMPIGTKYQFGSDQEQTATTSVVDILPPLTGYIKYKRGVI